MTISTIVIFLLLPWISFPFGVHYKFQTFLLLCNCFDFANFYFLLPIYGKKKALFFGSNFWNGDFDEFPCFEVPWIKKSHFQHLVCVSIISTTQKQIAAGTSNLVFFIYIKCRCYVKLYNDQMKIMHTEAHKRILIPHGLWLEFLVSEF